MIATLDDVIERLADEIGVYGAHVDGHSDKSHDCRVCWTADLRERIVAAVEIERKLGFLPSDSDLQLTGSGSGTPVNAESR